MPSFVDRKGQTWNVEITLMDLARLREAGLDVNKLKTDRDVLSALADVDVFGRVITILCEGEMQARGLSVHDFARLMNGPIIYAATEAILGAVADFTLPPMTAEVVVRGIAEQMAAADRQTAERARKALAGLSASLGGLPDTSDAAPQG